MPGSTAIDVLPVRVRIEAGYAVRRGNAIRRWAPDDFAFIRAPLRQEQEREFWIEQAVDAFCRRLEPRSTWDRTCDEEGRR